MRFAAGWCLGLAFANYFPQPNPGARLALLVLGLIVAAAALSSIPTDQRAGSQTERTNA